MDLREQACWLLLVFESGLTNRLVNSIIALWCKQLGRSLQDFFEADEQEWHETCQLKPEIMQKLEQAKEKRLAQGFLVEQLEDAQIRMITVLDPDYPALLKSSLGLAHIPPILFVMGDLQLLDKRTIAIIGSRNASATSLDFTRTIARSLAQQGTNVISGNARGVDRAAYEGATSTDEGHTTVVLPHGIRKLSKVQMRDLQPRIEAGNVLLMSQFHPDAQWVVSRAMERNKVVTGLAQIVIVAEADIKGGTWEGAKSALAQKRLLYVRQGDASSLPGNETLIQQGGMPFLWPTEHMEDTVTTLLREGSKIQKKQQKKPMPADQQSLFAS
ncbi:MAG: hypothetical protein NVSMB38_23610 [Ktedonobacteraceae bacterium]